MLADLGRRVLSRRYRGAAGFTLIELMIAITILGVLTAFALPNYSQWIANTRLRTAATGLQNGLMLAKAEAIARNAKVQLVMTDTDPTVANVGAVAPSATGRSWMVRLYHANGVYVASDFIQGRSNAGDGAGTSVAAGQSGFVFTGAGGMSPIPAASLAINVAGTGASRPLRVTLSPGSAIRMCDPALSIATTTMGC